MTNSQAKQKIGDVTEISEAEREREERERDENKEIFESNNLGFSYTIIDKYQFYLQ